MLPNKTPYLIGETAFHHQGDFDFLKDLVDTAIAAKINAIKFHLLIDIDDYFIKNHQAYDIVKEWIFTEKKWEEIINYSINKGLDVILLCNDSKSIDFVIKQGGNKIKAIEIHSSGLNDYNLLEKAAKFNGTVILGIGGSTIDEISYAIDMLNELGQEDIFLMYGFQSYPTKYEEINLNKMLKIKDLFNLPVGYADHTDPLDEYNEYISVMGIPMGINVCEKHFTHAFGEKRIDSQSAINLMQLEKVINLMKIASLAVSSGNLKMPDNEITYGNTGPMKKAIVASVPIKKGEVISIDKISFKRTNDSTYMQQNFLPKIIGLIANNDINVDDIIDFTSIQYAFKNNSIEQFKSNKK